MPDIRIPNLGGGVNKGDPRELIQIFQVADTLNIKNIDGVPQSRTGYTNDVNTNIAGTPMLHGHHYQDGITGLKRFWIFTGSGAFYKDVLTDVWTDGDGGLAIAATIDSYFSTTEIVELTSLKNFMIVNQADNKPIGNPTTHAFTPVYKVEKPTGGMRFLKGSDGYSDNTSQKHFCKKVIEYSDHLFLLHTQETHGTITYDLFQRVRWSDTASFQAEWAWNATDRYTSPTISINRTDGLVSNVNPSVITASSALAIPDVNKTDGVVTNADPSVVTSAAVFNLTVDILKDLFIYLDGTDVIKGYYLVASNTATDITLNQNAVVRTGISATGVTVRLTNQLAGASIYLSGTNVTDGYYTIASNDAASITLEENAATGVATGITLSLDLVGRGVTAGFIDLKSEYGAILTGEIIGTTLVIYMEEAIYACNATTSASAPFRFDVMLEVGLLAPRLLIATPLGHFFVGRDNAIYHYTGGKNLTRIGREIEVEFFANLHKGDNSGFLVRNRSFGVHFRDDHAVGFMIPTGSGSETTKNPDTMYVYFYRKKQWEIWTFADNFTGWGEYEQPIGSTAMTMPIFGDNTATNAKVYHWDYNDTADDGNAINARLETKDFVIDLKNEYRVARVHYEAKGNTSSATVKIEVSLDGGVSWNAETTTETLSTSWNSYRADFNVTGYQMRFRFSNATLDHKFYLGSVNIEVEKSNEVK